MTSATAARHGARVGIGYRSAIAEWTRANLKRFDVLEVTVDHCIYGGPAQRAEIFDLVGRVPLNAHGIGLSIGTDVPLDLAYLDEVAEIVERLRAPTYSEHLAFTRVPGRDLANLLPLPKTESVAESIIAKVRTVQSRVSRPLPAREYLLCVRLAGFEFVGRRISQSDLPRDRRRHPARHRESVFERAQPWLRCLRFSRHLSAGLVKEVHMAGGIAVNEECLQRAFLADSHSHPMPDETLDLLEYALARHAPATIVLERDDRLEASDEILGDVARIRACVVAPMAKKVHGKAIVGSAS